MITDECLPISNSAASNECYECPFGDDLDNEQRQRRSVIAEDDDKGLTSSSATSLTFPGVGILQIQNEENSDVAIGSAGGDGVRASNNIMCRDGVHHSTQSASHETLSLSSKKLIIPHRGSLRRILNPSSFAPSLRDATLDQSSHSQLPNSLWPMYIIDVATEDCQQQNPRYQVLFDRLQYEFCTRLFAVLDTESKSFVGPGCIREFVTLYCPMVRRRDYAIFALRGSCDDDDHERNRGSPTFDEIWKKTIHSDPNYLSYTDGATYRIGIEGWMIFCRLLALTHHQETQRRFASRHLQQMMRHKHGGGATTSKANEVVVVVENPPPGPPALISLCSLAEVEKERFTRQSEQCIQGWQFYHLPAPEFDLGHYLGDDLKFIEKHREPRGRVSVEQFSSAKDGDFILRLHRNGSTTVVRRSYSDFQWLNEVFEFHKRPSQGHLCGRILPPLPSEQLEIPQQLSTTPNGATQAKDISERAIGVAKSGIMIISSITKSVLSGFVSSSTHSPSPKSSLSGDTVWRVSKMSSPPAQNLSDVALRIERYLNYLLENDAFSTSFPLFVILNASQSGLESAKQILRDQTKHNKRQKSELEAAMTRDQPHSAAYIFSALLYKTSTSILRIQGGDDTRWLRAAAQVAMALQFHGILESIGHESTSAKLQHASLPKFGLQGAESWDDEEIFHDKHQPSDCNSPRNEANFEVGVINVESELADEEQDFGGYDMLPSPGPSEENRVLNAGVSSNQVLSKSSSITFVYDATPEQSKGNHNKKDAIVGSVKVECDIDKLHDIIFSTKRTLGKLYQSCSSIQSAQAAKKAIELCILRDVDSWVDNCREVITQRALVGGVATLESCNRDEEKINKSLADDLLWQSLLAASAVRAVSEVRGMVRATRTASGAKSAAFAAAEKYKKLYEACDRSLPIEKVRHAQLEASTAQSNAIHATVVEYEANVVKKRSAISFANDIKSWNNHRKRELLRSCIQAAKSQRDACRSAADAWEGIRDGLVDFSACAIAIDEANSHSMKQHMIGLDVLRSSSVSDAWKVNRNVLDIDIALQSPHLLALDTDEIRVHSPSLDKVDSEQQIQPDCATDPVEGGLSYFSSLMASDQSGIEDIVHCLPSSEFSLLNENYFSSHQEILARSYSDSDDTESGAEQIEVTSDHGSIHSVHDSVSLPKKDPMTTSMDSLIDSLLMTWGGENENERDADLHENELCATVDHIDCSRRNNESDT